MNSDSDDCLQACPACGAHFECGMASDRPTCWCAELPPTLVVPDGGGRCYCRSCLDAAIRKAAAASPAAEESRRG